MGVFFASQNWGASCDDKKMPLCQNMFNSSSNRCTRTKPKPKEADMFTGNLNSAYEYENERRNDERRAAAESRALRELGVQRKLSLPSPQVVVVMLVVLVMILKVV